MGNTQPKLEGEITTIIIILLLVLNLCFITYRIFAIISLAISRCWTPLLVTCHDYEESVMNSSRHNIFLISRSSQSGEITWSPPATSYLTHWLPLRNFIILNTVFLITKMHNADSSPKLKKWCSPLAKHFDIIHGHETVSNDPVRPLADSRKVNISAPPPQKTAIRDLSL